KVVHEPGFTGPKGRRARSAAAKVESGSVRQSHVANEAVWNHPRNGPSCVARDHVVAMMITRWIEGSLTFKHAQAQRILTQYPIDLICRKGKSSIIPSESVNESRGPASR